MGKNKILFITSTNLATNPRLVKELRLGLEQGLQPTVIQFILGNWSDTMTNVLKGEFKGVEFIELSALRRPFWQWFSSSVMEKFARLLPVNLLNGLMLAVAVSKRSLLLTKAVNKIGGEFKWVVAHNPAAFYPAYIFFKKKSALLGVDVEDYHPGEGTDNHLQAVTKKLMNTVLPAAGYVSFASPLIKKAVEKDTAISSDRWLTVMNYFSSEEFIEPYKKIAGPVKLVWFSQNISAGRGLELILPFIKTAGKKVELHLYGNLDEAFNKQYLKDMDNVFLHAAIPQKQLHKELVNYDTGLALEPAKDRNNELAVSNKLLAYLQAGLFVLATDTEAQQAILSGFPGHGYCFSYKENDSAVLLQKIIDEIETIRESSQWRFRQFVNHSWENESKPLVKIWNEVQ